MMIPTPDGDIVLNLEKNNFLAAGFNIKNDRKETVSYEPGLFYQGEIDGQPGSFAAISFFDDEVVAVINTIGNKKYVVGQSNALRRESYLVYDAAQATAPSIDCMSESLPGYIEKSSHINLPKLEQRAADGCVNAYFNWAIAYTIIKVVPLSCQLYQRSIQCSVCSICERRHQC
ncbi:MAG: hypothetical protein IPO25_06530 [Saprospiraceae bacterium]|nr:hypothetical protein [Saprospiraceae bacterium]